MRQSPSSINTYRSCPRKFWYQYISKPEVKPSIHMEKGSCIHSVLEEFYKSYGNDFFKLLIKHWNLLLPKLKQTGVDLEPEFQDCKKILEVEKTLLEIKLNGLVPLKYETKLQAFNSFKPKFSEKFLESKSMNLCCKIDRIDINRFTGVITLGDYKTSKIYGIELSEDYLRQQVIMAILYKETEGVLPDFGVTIFLRYGLSDRVRITPDLVNWGINEINYVKSRTLTEDKEDYPKKESGLCRYCSYFDICSGIKQDKLDKAKQNLLKKFGG